MIYRFVSLILSAVCASMIFSPVSVARAGERLPELYCGTVIFDRWDSCILYSGVYVMYVSETVKGKLRDHAGKSIQIDAKVIEQPINPGDGLIKDFVYQGSAPPTQNWVSLQGLRLDVAPALEDDERPRLSIAIQNSGSKDVEVFSQEFAPTLLRKKPIGKPSVWSLSDGPSIARITRQAFWLGYEPRTKGRGWSIQVGLPRTFILQPGEKRVVTISFDLPAGEYDFLAGYGGGTHAGKGISSNLIAFDVTGSGKTKIVKIKGR